MDCDELFGNLVIVGGKYKGDAGFVDIEHKKMVTVDLKRHGKRRIMRRNAKRAVRAKDDSQSSSSSA
jgi:hypothetical protein